MRGVRRTTTIVVDGVEVTVTGTVYPGRDARLYGPPEDCWPEEPPWVDLESARAEGCPVDLVHLLHQDALDDAREALLLAVHDPGGVG